MSTFSKIQSHGNMSLEMSEFQYKFLVKNVESLNYKRLYICSYICYYLRHVK